jgi:hypothetical protein
MGFISLHQINLFLLKSSIGIQGIHSRPINRNFVYYKKQINFGDFNIFDFHTYFIL